MSPHPRLSEQLTIHSRTPALAVCDPRGLAVRSIGYYRRQAATPAVPRINAQWHDCAGRPIAQWDPRQFAQFCAGNSETPNQRTTFSLSGATLRQHNADSGWKIMLHEPHGMPTSTWDSRGIVTHCHYDDIARLVATVKCTADGQPRTAQRVSYAAANAEQASRNLCGAIYRHDDDAGTVFTEALDIQGQTISTTRHYLAGEVAADWPQAHSERDALLESGAGYQSTYLHDATGQLLSHADALGNVQQFGHDVSGAQNAAGLVTAQGTEHELLRATVRDAADRVVSQTTGNGVTSRNEYDPIDLRLRRSVSRRADNTVLQDLHYLYDPIGNVTQISDEAQPVRYFANQRTEPTNLYRYDSFNQLIEARGREAANTGGDGPLLPPLLALPQDASLLLNYTQHLSYDEAGNLVELRHVNGQRNRTQRMAVARANNRSLAERNGQLPDETQLAAAFDRNGNAHALEAGQALAWDEYNQLHEVATVRRDDGQNDYERYCYDASGARVRKQSTALQSRGSRVCEVRYLPGLEIRTDSRSGEQLHVIIAQAGSSAVRLLHWAEGKPEALPNDQLRYNLSNHLDSCTLEVDKDGHLLSREEYYPFGGTACWAGRSAVEAKYKTVRYSGKERDASGLYYYGLRYYAPWLMRWINPDPGGDIDGLNLYAMVGNNPVSMVDSDGRAKTRFDTLDDMIAAGPTAEYLEGQPSWGRGSKEEQARKYNNWKGHCKTWFNRARDSRARVLLASFEITHTRSAGVIQALKNMESNTELAKSVALRGATIVVSNTASTGVGGATGALIGSALAPGPGTVIGAGIGMVVGKLASVAAEKGMEHAGNHATLDLHTGSLGASSIIHDGKIRKNGFIGKAYGKFSSLVPKNKKNGINFATEAFKTVGSKALGPHGILLKLGVDGSKAALEIVKTQQEKKPAKLDRLEADPDKTFAMLYERTLRVAKMYGASEADDPLPGLNETLSKTMTLGDLAAKFGAAVDSLHEAGEAVAAFRQRHPGKTQAA